MRNELVSAWVIGLLAVSSSALAAKTNYKAAIEGGAVGSPGTGVGNFTFDDATKRLCGKATYAGLTGGPVTVAALKEGDNFTVVSALTVSASPIVVDVVLSDQAVPLLATGPIYIAIGNATRGVAAGQQMNGEVNGELVVDPAGVEQRCGAVADAGPGSDAAVSVQPDAGGRADGGEISGALPPGAAPTVPAASTPDEGGCSTSSSPTSSVALFATIGALVVALRGRRRQ